MSDQNDILELTRQLLDSIGKGDWATYSELCDPTLTAFEPEACGHLIAGLEFHRFYFNLPSRATLMNTSMAEPQVRVMGDVAVVAYTRLIQCKTETAAEPTVSSFQETRVWQRRDGRWKQVHFHRS
jgi:calcium/calmodulin-dependent protein kinase (CaM kinase) II